MSSMKQDRRKGEQEDYRVIDDKAKREEKKEHNDNIDKEEGTKIGQGDKRDKEGKKGNKDNKA